MMRLMTALLMLGLITATATTAIAGCNTCNPNAPRCRQICPPPRHPRHHTTQTHTQFAIAIHSVADHKRVQCSYPQLHFDQIPRENVAGRPTREVVALLNQKYSGRGCAGCGEQFDRKGLRCCSADCERKYSER